jgi:hypothetical protein
MSLENDFAAELDHALNVAKTEHKVQFPKLRNMIKEFGSVQSAKILLNEINLSDGFINLASLGRLDLSIEFLATKSKYQELFTEFELDNANKRLGVRSNS